MHLKSPTPIVIETIKPSMNAVESQREPIMAQQAIIVLSIANKKAQFSAKNTHISFKTQYGGTCMKIS